MRKTHPTYVFFFVLILVILGTLPLSLSAQDMLVQYIYKRYPLINNNSELVLEQARTQNLEDKYLRTVRYTLHQKNNESVFHKSINALQEESNTNFYHRHEKDTVYKSLADGALLMCCEIGGLVTYEVEGSLHRFDYQLHQEKRIILGYECYKATIIEEGSVGETWTAWYATDIPIPNGPLHFGGLPGLILQLQNSNNTYSFTAEQVQIGNENLPVRTIEKPVFENPIGLAEYHQKTKELFQKLNFGSRQRN